MVRRYAKMVRRYAKMADPFTRRQFLNTVGTADSPGDAWGAQMRSSALVLADKRAVTDVVAYINTLQTAK